MKKTGVVMKILRHGDQKRFYFPVNDGVANAQVQAYAMLSKSDVLLEMFLEPDGDKEPVFDLHYNPALEPLIQRYRDVMERLQRKDA
jgi:hypothetical protein